MSQTKATLFRNSFKLPNPGLRAYFERVKSGQPEVFDTPFARGESTSDLLQNWEHRLVAIKREWPSLWEFEIDLSRKVGPTSVMKPLSERLPDIEHYYSDILRPSEPISAAALNEVLKEWKSARGIRIRDPITTMENMKLSTNSGAPYFTKRNKVTSETISLVRNVVSDSAMTMFRDSRTKDHYLATAVLGWRGQEAGHAKEDTKQRVVWMFPFAVNILELSAYQPLIKAAQHSRLVPAWVSSDLVDSEVTKLFATKGKDDLVVCTDFSRFDQHFNRDLQSAAHYIIQRLLTPGDLSTRWLQETFPIKYNIPIAIGWNHVLTGNHGMASGSGGTNFDETVVHRSLQYEAALKANKLLNPHSMCLGDDGILSYPGIDVDDVVQCYSSHGLDMNPSKQYASTQDCVYLRRWYHRDYAIDGINRGVYSTFRALGRLRYLERFQDPKVWGPKMVALRQLSILENVKWHPMRKEFVEFCMKRDKFRLGLDIPGFLDELPKHAKEAMDNIKDLMSYTQTLQGGKDDISGINNWWIVKELQSRR